MSRYFSDEQIFKLEDELLSLPRKTQSLIEAFLLHNFLTNEGQEYAHHGIARRLGTLEYAIQRVFECLPPTLDDLPDRRSAKDATIFIQAFVFNIFGLLDNLAFVWAFEADVKGNNGLPLPNGRIGLTKDKIRLRESLPTDAQQYLEKSDTWLVNLERFRHSLGHRIPLYIPPFCIDPENAERYRTINEQKREALNKHDFEYHEQLSAEQTALTFFRPWMQASLNDPLPPVVFHAQLISDFATAEEISWTFIKALRTLDFIER